jgi:hypothetical protein
MKNLKNKLIQAGIYLSLIVFGYAITRLIEIPHFEISKSIDVSNVLTLIVTAWLAILITTVFEKQNNDHRVEKDLIITRVGNIYDIADSLQLESNSGRIHITEASSSLKRINSALNSIYRIVDKCHFNITDDLKDRLKNSLADIRNTLTNTPSVTDEQLNSKDLPIEIKDSIIHFNKERVSQLEVKFDTLKDLLLELQIHINNK